MTDDACIELVFTGLLSIAVMVMGGLLLARLIIAASSCTPDHGHGQAHDLPCDCACHRTKA